jgi:uncharacterized membrane-anchored protein
VSLAAVVVAAAFLAHADPAVERATDAFNKQLPLHAGPANVDVGPANLAVPANVVWLDADGAKAWERLTNNVASGKERALLGLASGARVLVEYADVGFVDADANATLANPDVLLAALASASSANVKPTSWSKPPMFDASTHALSWCTASSASWACAHRLLSRHGFVALTVLGDANVDRDKSEAELAPLVAGIVWKPGESYAERAPDDVKSGLSLDAVVASGGVLQVDEGSARVRRLVVGRGRFLGMALAVLVAAGFATARRMKRR